MQQNSTFFVAYNTLKFHSKDIINLLTEPEKEDSLAISINT